MGRKLKTALLNFIAMHSDCLFLNQSVMGGQSLGSSPSILHWTSFSHHDTLLYSSSELQQSWRWRETHGFALPSSEKSNIPKKFWRKTLPTRMCTHVSYPCSAFLTAPTMVPCTRRKPGSIRWVSEWEDKWMNHSDRKKKKNWVSFPFLGIKPDSKRFSTV